MGISIKSKNKKGITLYQLRSSISNELLHKEEWVDTDGAKKALINDELWDFIAKAQRIDMDFPNGYRIDGVYSNKTPNYFAYTDIVHKMDDGGKQQYLDFLATMHRLGMYLEDSTEIEKIIADIRNKLTPLFNLAYMVAEASDLNGISGQLTKEANIARENGLLVKKSLQDILNLFN